MIKFNNYLLGGLGAAFLVVGGAGCQSMNTSADQLLKNSSFHILVHDEHPIPESGTFLFDTKVFKINQDEQVDLYVIEARITSALRAELEGKGFREVTENPDLMVSYAVALNAPLSGADIHSAYSDEFPVNALVPVEGDDLHYNEGALIVDFVDSHSRTLLWRGAIMAELSRDASEDDKDRRVQLATEILLDHFPKP